MVNVETKVINGLEENKTPPSTLHLFRYKGLELANLQERASTALQLEKNLSRTEISLEKLNAAKNARIDRLSQTVRELSEQLDNSTSSISCGAVYLKMRAELPNLFPKDFMEFFNLCLKGNTFLSDQAINSVNTRGVQATLIQALSRMNAMKISLENQKISDAMIGNPPEWFTGNKRDWQLFFMSHANFTLYLNNDLLENVAARPKSILKKGIDRFEEIGKGYGITKEGEFPDWLLEGSGILPTREEVEEELAEDKEQEIKTVNALEKIREQGNYLMTACTEKTQKAIARLSDLTQKAFPNIQNFADMILFLEVAHKTGINVPFEKVITDCTQSYDILKISEPIALYIEDKLLEGKIIQSTQDLINANFTDLFAALLESLKEKEESSLAKFQELRNTNKKVFGTLNYDIKPFLEVLSGSELSFLQDLLQDSNGKPTELFIWDIAGLVSSAFKAIQEEDLEKSQRGAIHYLQKFMGSFLRNHSKFAYGELKENSQDKRQEQEKLEPEDSLATAPLREEIESATEGIAQGNLAGWHIFYTDNKTSNESHLIEVGGATPEERELALQQLFLKEHESLSIKPGSIVRALEWLVTVPEEVEQLRIRKNITGEVFRKIKRGDIRIFYVMDKVKKSIVFFTHLKKSFNYGF